MKHQLFFGIAFRVILLFVLAMLGTYIPENLRDFFGDVKYTTQPMWPGAVDKFWFWGSRHYWYFWMMVTLFLLSLINLILSVIHLINKYYPNKY